jgi:hypothetical protein
MLAHPDVDARTPFSERSSSHLTVMAEATGRHQETTWLPASAGNLVSTLLCHRYDRQSLAN